jgi:excisionase family DNA binding protein
MTWEGSEQLAGQDFGKGTLRDVSLEVLTVEQLADRFQLSQKTVYRSLERRELRGAKLRNRWRIRLEDAERWFDDHVPEPVKPARPRNRRPQRGPLRESSLRAMLATDRDTSG